MGRGQLNQVIIGAAPGDAITDQALLIRRWLREMGFASEIFAESIDPALEGEVRPVSRYRPGADEKRVIYHHSIGSATAEQLLSAPVRLVLIYHNITPPEFFETLHPPLARQMALGRGQLARLRERTDLALGDSAYNEAELREAGFGRTGVLPITLDEGRYQHAPNPELLARFEGAGPRLLFVGRLVPNKKQDDLIKLLCYYRRLQPEARLVLVGEPWVPAYARWLKELAIDLGLRQAVVFAGRTTQRDLVTYYKLADAYVSLSEHEGFGKPLIESMYLDLPVLAYAAAAVPATLGGSAVLLRHKHYEAIAEVVELLVHDRAMRERVVARQRERVQSFLEPSVRRTWAQALGSAGIV